LYCSLHAIGSASLGGILEVKKPAMKKPTRMEVVRRAYELWQKAGQPEGRDQEFYHQAERELEAELSTIASLDIRSALDRIAEELASPRICQLQNRWCG
jgi:hypothetical protein